jgi:hypothetical protein
MLMLYKQVVDEKVQPQVWPLLLQIGGMLAKENPWYPL